MKGRSLLDFVDARWVLWSYAAFALLGGLSLAVLGPEWLNARDHAPSVRAFGLMLTALAPLAAALALVQNPILRRLNLAFLLGAHVVVSVSEQFLAPAAWPDAGDTLANLLFAVSALLIYVQLGAEPAQPRRRTLFVAPGNLRSRYEQQTHAMVAQQERARLARDLHDSVKQQIFAIQTSAAAAQERLATDASGAQQALAQVRNAARDAAAEMDAMLAQLQAEPLENVGLIEALRKQCEALEARSGATVSLEISELPANSVLAPGTQQEIFRIAQEALSNVARHARAKHVNVSLRAALGKLELRVSDDGQGFDSSRVERRLGLANMRARAEQLGGTFEIISQPAGGASIIVEAPYETFEAPRYYLKQLLTSAAAGAIGAAVFWRSRGPGMLVFLAISAILILYNLLAYRRAKQS